MKNNQIPKLAFSLIELSVVILIIGILVIGISKGSTILKASKLKSAQSLTTNSPVASMSDLVMWLESTSEKSFDDNEEVNNGLITNWYDLNPQATSINNATQSVVGDKPKYMQNRINGLPAINFDGSSDFMNLPTPAALGISNSDYEFFVVYKTSSSTDVQFLLASSSVNGIYELHLNGVASARFIPNSSASDLNFSNILGTHIISARIQNDSGIIRVDGVQGNAVTSARSSNASANAAILFIGKRGSGGNLWMRGDIGEIILFRRSLTNSERVAVEGYLKTKWGVK